ncbi:MAG: acyl-CoA dehydratase activase [Desulfomonilia bacterium]|uniref:Putative CoA-substrate-specific enzyme activase n=1 Tax=anaerobic digester metagenome TaxID=1263854 RepID=A0A485M5S9_9ZZZZ
MKNIVIGIDAGSVSVGLAVLGPGGEIAAIDYRIHRGRIRETLAEMLGSIDLQGEFIVAVTSSTPFLVRFSERVDNQVAVISAARRLHPGVRSILQVGAEKFSLILLDSNGNYISSRTNTSCAAGTGSFLDQQAVRLSLESTQELSRLALENRGQVPMIASRCAVFAKTDIIHAQQEGYSLSEICDGLCRGLARNIADTLFAGRDIQGPVVFCGGVSKNKAVQKHIGDIVGREFVVDGYSHVYGALGAAIRLLERAEEPAVSFVRTEDLILPREESRAYAFDGLCLAGSSYPDFSSHEHYDYRVRTRTVPDTVEVDVYEDLSGIESAGVYLGIDIGSTSTKAVLMDGSKTVLAGLYTRTAGRPVDAVCAVFEAVCDLGARYGFSPVILGSGTTGSGRKLIGGIIRADMVVDEISAHAKAACELNPDADTIIEIGGQDSKFTTLKDGQVNFSVMNTVCAAGTGSFIEEQARKMNCPLSEYAERTLGVRAPRASDRCTVFMERDMNYCLSEGYSPDEVLASALHSVCENYLTKVAVEGMIGRTILFQGATAKNKALVAAFEHRLGRPIIVSKFCHLTGAMGVALMMLEKRVEQSAFAGLDLYRRQIPVRTEVCTLCTNSCKITVADIDGRSVAYGFLCGRDYETGKRVDPDRSGFDLLKQRKKVQAYPSRRGRPGRGVTIGIPAALHLFDDLEFWQCFFDLLSIKTVTSRGFRGALKEGRHLAGAEFCAPLTALHGHIAYLLDKCDYVFVPFYFEERNQDTPARRQYCYYTQYAPSLAGAAMGEKEHRVLSPLVRYLYSGLRTKFELFAILKKILGRRISYREVSHAYDSALAFREQTGKALIELCAHERAKARGIQVVLLGRPYTVLDPSMNKGIIDIFASHGVPVYFQDMIPVQETADASLKELLDDLPWKHAADILRTADIVAGMEGVYPVLVTSFRCSPDSFAAEYFKNLMNSRGKPYLILQLDEHDSNVGYETRIEAGLRSFTNHFSRRHSAPPTILSSISPVERIEDKTIIIPNWDRFSCSLLAALLRREGLDARLMDQTGTDLQRSLRHNTGQCIPINIMAQEFMDYIVQNDLDPGRCMLWMGNGEIPCNLKVIPHHIKNILNKSGPAMSRAQVYRGDISFLDISLKAVINAYFAFMFGGMLRRVACRLRPYEVHAGSVDEVIEDALKLFVDAFEGLSSREDVLKAVVDRLRAIPLKSEPRPRVAIFGDLYVRDNDAMNQGLISFVEACGGEVITTPYSSYAKMVSRPYFKKWFNEGKYVRSFSCRAVLSALTALEKKYYRHFQQVLREPDHEFNDPVADILAPYRLRSEHSGETMDNILKTYYIRKYYPDVALFIHVNPAFCCPALVTEAMAGRIERLTGVPVVNVTYDGTFGDKNSVIVPYLAFARRSGQADSVQDAISRAGDVLKRSS